MIILEPDLIVLQTIRDDRQITNMVPHVIAINFNDSIFVPSHTIICPKHMPFFLMNVQTITGYRITI